MSPLKKTFIFLSLLLFGSVSFANSFGFLDPATWIVAFVTSGAEEYRLSRKRADICDHSVQYLNFCQQAANLSSQEIYAKIFDSNAQVRSQYRHFQDFSSQNYFMNYFRRSTREDALKSIQSSEQTLLQKVFSLAIQYPDRSARWELCRAQVSQLTQCRMQFYQRVQQLPWYQKLQVGLGGAPSSKAAFGSSAPAPEARR